MLPKLLTIDDICQTLGIGRTTAYKLIKDINHTKIGRRILVSEDDLIDYIRSHSNSSKKTK